MKPGAVLGNVMAHASAHALAIVGVTAAFLAVLLSSATEMNTFDPHLFAGAGERLLSSDWTNTLDDRHVQVGPLHLLFFGLVGKVAAFTGIDYLLLLSLAVQVPLALGAAYVADRLARSSGSSTPPAAGLLAGLAVLALAHTWTAFQSAQLGEVVVPLLWMLAAVEARRDRAWAAGILIGVATGFKLWALLGLPLLLVASRRRSLVGVACWIGVTAILWGPFFVLGDVSLLDYRWPLWEGSLFRALDPDGIYMTWWMRLLQGAIVVSVGAVGVVLGRRGSISLWLVPTVLIGVKVLLDPAFWYWYWLGIEVSMVVGAAVALTRRVSRQPRSLALTALVVTGLALPPGARSAGIVALLAMAGLIWLTQVGLADAAGERRAPVLSEG